MNGMVIPGTPIAVDFWKISTAPEARLFFLTHVHADHIQGLTNSWRFPIFTSETSAALLKLKFKFSRDVTRSLEVGETYQIPLDDEDEHIMSVTVLDANHVPGSVMFLFQGYFGNYLYCGDMRWYPELLEHPVLKSIVERRELDCIYLDNTFSAPYCVFPSRGEAKKEVFSIIDRSPNSEIKIGIRTLGKEEVLEAVARRYQERILVSQEKYEMLKVLKSPDVYTTDPKQARIQAVPMAQIKSRTHDKWNEETPTVSIILTALYVGWPNGPYSISPSRGLHVVPYSDHSSFSELQEMVGCMAPREVVPLVRQWSTKGWWSEPTAPNQNLKWDMSLYDHLLTPPPPDPFITPKAVEETMKLGSRFLLDPQVRHCSLRRGLMSTPIRAKRIRIGARFSSPKPKCLSPTHTASTSIDMSVCSNSSTPSHTSQPWKISELSQYSFAPVSRNTYAKPYQGNWVNPVPFILVNSSTQTTPCTICIHGNVVDDGVPSVGDDATKISKLRTSEKGGTEEENDQRCNIRVNESIPFKTNFTAQTSALTSKRKRTGENDQRCEVGENKEVPFNIDFAMQTSALTTGERKRTEGEENGVGVKKGIPSKIDCATQTLELRLSPEESRERENEQRCKVKEQVILQRSKVEEIKCTLPRQKTECIVSARILTYEVAEECRKKNSSLKVLIERTKSLCDILRITNAQY